MTCINALQSDSSSRNFYGLQRGRTKDFFTFLSYLQAGIRFDEKKGRDVFVKKVSRLNFGYPLYTIVSTMIGQTVVPLRVKKDQPFVQGS